MSKRSVFTTITALPPQVSRETAIEVLHSHTEMIDLNPLVIDRHPTKAPGKATPEEFHCTWYSITDRVSYVPGGMVTSKVTYNACFHDLEDGLQTHVYAPAGLDIKEKWSIGGTAPGEAPKPVEIGQGIPLTGLYLREDIDMTCNVFLVSFVKKTLKKAHAKLIARLLVRAQLDERDKDLERMTQQSASSSSTYSPRNHHLPKTYHPSPIFLNQSPRFQQQPGLTSEESHHVNPPPRSQNRPKPARNLSVTSSVASSEPRYSQLYRQQTLPSESSRPSLQRQSSNLSPAQNIDPAYIHSNPFTPQNAFGIYAPGAIKQQQLWEQQQYEMLYGRDGSGYGVCVEMAGRSSEDKRSHGRHPSDGSGFAVELEADVPAQPQTKEVDRESGPPVPAKC